MSDYIKFNEVNSDVCEREANALREIVVVAMGRLRQMRKQRGRGCVSLEEFYDALDAYEAIRGRTEELDQLGFEFRWSSAADVGLDEYTELEWDEDDSSPLDRGFDIAC